MTIDIMIYTTYVKYFIGYVCKCCMHVRGCDAHWYLSGILFAENETVVPKQWTRCAEG
jgi:hypothetical protein